MKRSKKSSVKRKAVKKVSRPKKKTVVKKRASTKKARTTPKKVKRRSSSPKIASIKIPNLCVKMKYSSRALGLAVGILSAIWILGLAVLGRFGYALPAVEVTKQFYLTFSLTTAGIIAGVVESFICGFVVGWLLAWLYNKFC